MICNDITILNILTILKSIIRIIKIAVPVILVIFVMIDIVKTIASPDAETKKMTKSISKRLIAAAVIFLIPTIIDFGLGFVPNGNGNFLDCYNNASKENVIKLSVDNSNVELENMNRAMKENDKSAAALYYEKARQAIKTVPKGSEKDDLKSRLETYKRQLDSM